MTTHALRRLLDSRWLPAVVAACAVLMTATIWYYLDRHESRVRNAILEANVNTTASEITSRLKPVRLSLLRMAQRQSLNQYLQSHSWLNDAHLYVRHDSAYLALLLLDSEWRTLSWISRQLAGDDSRTIPGAPGGQIAKALAACRQPQATQYFCTFTQATGEAVLVIVNPVTESGRTGSRIIALLDAPLLLQEALTANPSPYFSTTVSYNGQALYRRRQNGEASAEICTTRAPGLPDLAWQVSICAAPGSVIYQSSLLPRISIALGLILAALLTAMTRAAQLARQRGDTIAATNRVLEDEIAQGAIIRDGLQRRGAVLDTISRSAHLLLRGEPLERAIPAMLGQLGEVTGTSRAYVFENQPWPDGKPHATLSYEWSAAGIPGRIGKPATQNLPLELPGLGPWIARLAQGEAVGGRLHDLPPEVRAIVSSHGVQSLLLAPILVNGHWWGGIGFDDCVAERTWSPPKINTLLIAGSIIGAAIERLQAEQQVRESDAQLRQLAENIREVFWSYDLRENRLLYVSPSYEEIFGQSRDRLYADFWTCLESIHPQDRERVRVAMEEAIAGHKEFDIDHRIIRPDGSQRWLWVRGFPVTHGASGTPRLTGITEDITDRHMAEQARITQAEQQRDVLVREVHHRINNNLQGVIGLLRQHISKSPDLKSALEEAIGHISTIATIHGLHSHHPLQPQVSIGDLLEAVVKALRSMRPTPVELERAASTEDWNLSETEAVPVALVVNELVCNAMKHTLPDKPGPVRVELRAANGNVLLQIRNPSSGLPAGFDLESGTAIGAGLALVKSLMPPKGAQLSIRYRDSEVETVLTLEPPVVSHSHPPSAVRPKRGQ